MVNYTPYTTSRPKQNRSRNPGIYNKLKMMETGDDLFVDRNRLGQSIRRGVSRWNTSASDPSRRELVPSIPERRIRGARTANIRPQAYVSTPWIPTGNRY